MTLEELRQAYPKLSPAGKRQVLEALERGLDELQGDFLTPRIPFKVVEPPTSPAPNTEDSVREFFLANPDATEVRIGNTLYYRK